MPAKVLDEALTSSMIQEAVDIVSAYVSYNSLPSSDLPSLLASVHVALTRLGSPRYHLQPAQKPSAATIRRSVTADGIVSFLDGKIYKTLKRHLSSHGLTPEAYRRRYHLPTDYPMVAAGYAAARSELAKSLGLGQLRNGAARPFKNAHRGREHPLGRTADAL